MTVFTMLKDGRTYRMTEGLLNVPASVQLVISSADYKGKGNDLRWLTTMHCERPPYATIYYAHDDPIAAPPGIIINKLDTRQVEYTWEFAPLFQYFLDNYDNLPEYIVTGHFPFDHDSQFLGNLYRAIVDMPEFAGLQAYTREVTDLHASMFKYQMPIPAVWQALFKTPDPPLPFTCRTLAVLLFFHKSRVLCRSRRFWQRCLAIAQFPFTVSDGIGLYAFPGSAHCYRQHPVYALEHLMEHLLDPKYEAAI